VLVVAMGASTAVQAQGGDRVAAESLFQDAKRLMTAGKYAEACPKFETSQRLDPGVGTMLNLADCYEKSGRVATAWAMFLEAASGARAAGNAAREKAARDRADALGSRLAKVTIVVSPSREVPGMVITRDGKAIDRALWGTAVPVDPGSRVIEVSAPGRQKWSTTLQVRSEKAELAVEVPELAKAGETAAPGTSTSNSTPSSAGADTKEVGSGGGSKTLLGVGLLAVGAGGVVLGSVFGLSAKSKWDDARSHCVVGNACLAESLPLADQARSNATISTVAFAVGAAGLAAGTIVLVTSSHRTSSGNTDFHVRASIDPANAGLHLDGAF
jgi:hypothetical protein